VISAEDLLVGASHEHEVEIPESLLPEADDRLVLLRPLTVRDLRLIAKATRDNGELSGALMVRQALVSPALSLEHLGALPAGLLQFLLAQVNKISGITASEDEVIKALEDPLVQATLLLSREMGWTPEDVGRLTIGETMLHVAALRGRGG
jgi:hypothetical protein